MSNNLDSLILKIDTAEKEYSILLQQYNVAYKTYVENLQNTSTTVPFVSIPGRTFWGTSGLKEGTATTATDCESMCASDMKCSGATFNPVKKYCWTRTGDGPLAVGQDNDYALIPLLKQNLILLKSLNKRLIAANNEISGYLKSLYPEVQEERLEQQQKQKELETAYGYLVAEQEELEQTFIQYQTVEEDLKNNTLYVNQQSMSLKIWVFLFFILLALIVKQFFLPEGRSGVIFLAIVLISILLVVFYKRM